MEYRDFNFWAKDHIASESYFDEDGNVIMENKSNFKRTGIIAKILEENWDNFYDEKKDKLIILRPNADYEVKKVIACANHELGASVYVCPNCDEVLFCHHTCKGKLCSSCGIKTQNIRTENILEKCIISKHRHMTFTMPKELTIWFIEDLYSLNILFESVNETLYSVVNGKHKKNKRIYDLKYKPGYFAFLHTYGRPLNFNPHIHVVLAENIFDGNTFKKCSYLDYNALSKRFMTILLDKMEKYFGKKKFRNTKNKMYFKYPNGFYVNNKLEDDGYKFNSIEELLRYVTRYCSRPVIAESRILDYNGKDVTWFYIDHKEEKRHEITEPVFSFIAKLLKHLLPTHFISIRSYGFYNKQHDLPDDTNMLIKKEKIPFRRSLLKWSNSILTSFKRIPIKCSKCETLMEPVFRVT